MKRFFCISALFLCAACANDLGNYDYRDLTEPDITGIEANISVLTHARLQLTPDLGGNDFPDDRYSFEWRTLARSADETVTVIGTSRNLDYEVALPAGAYTLFFKVTEDASGRLLADEQRIAGERGHLRGVGWCCAPTATTTGRASIWSPR